MFSSGVTCCLIFSSVVTETKTAPVAPVAPIAPVATVVPYARYAQVAPVAPVFPYAPYASYAPVAPVAPVKDPLADPGVSAAKPADPVENVVATPDSSDPVVAESAAPVM